MIRARLGGMVLLCALALTAPVMALAQEPSSGRTISRLLETAPLSADDKALIRQKAGDAARAGVAERDVVGLIQRGLNHGVRAPDLVRLLDVVAQAKRQDLPVGPVLDKVEEGLAKRVPAERVATVAAHISQNLAASRDVVRRAQRDGVRAEHEGEREKTVEAVAEALGRGVTTTQIEDLAHRVARSPQRAATLSRLEAAAQASADLVAMGLSPHDASETAAAVVDKGLTNQDIKKLRERLARELRRGRSPDEGAKFLRDEIQSTRPDRNLEPGTRREPDRFDRGPDIDRMPPRR